MPRVIYINGPSSVGKSTLTRALQNALAETYLRIGIDQMIGMMPTRLNDWSDGTVRTADNVSLQQMVQAITAKISANPE